MCCQICVAGYTVAMRIRALIPIFLLVLPLSASAASLYLDPDTGTYGPGDTFITNIRMNPEGDCVNAAEVTLSYPSQNMRAADFSKGSSILSLWVQEPKIDTKAGTVTFSGGIPGGYCGRIQGDPSVTNVIGKVVFTVTDTSARRAAIRFTNSALYLNDGRGTKIVPQFHDATIDLAEEPRQASNPWLAEVGADTIPPDPFDVQIESTRGVFGGKYYIVFTTVDKQSGIDHYEVVENGSWARAKSPHLLPDQSLRGGIEVRAIDKAGNIRLGTYIEGSAPPRVTGLEDYMALFVITIVLALVLVARHFLNRRKKSTTDQSS